MLLKCWKFSLSWNTIVSWLWVNWVICREARAAAGEEINVSLFSEQTAREEAMKNQTGINGEGLGCQFASLENSFLIKHSFSSHELSSLEPNSLKITHPTQFLYYNQYFNGFKVIFWYLVALALEWSCWQIPPQSVLYSSRSSRGDQMRSLGSDPL